MKMKNQLRDPSILIRLGLDFFLLHASMFLALTITAVYHLEKHPGLNSGLLLHELRSYYEWFAVAISPVFLLVLFLNGIYDKKMRVLNWKQRTIKLSRAVIAAVLVSLAIDYLFLRTHIVARSVTISFSFTLLLSFICSHWLQETFRSRYGLVARKGGTRRPVDAPVLVVGGGGYIGSVLCRKLLDAGERVRILDSFVYGDFPIASLKSHPRFEIIEGDCRHIQSVVGAIRDVKAVVDLAAIVGDPACEQDKQSALEINYAATRMLIEVAKGHGVERFIFASSCSVYGATDHVVNENSRVAPISLYGQTKVDSESALLEARSADFHPVILRLATVFGNGYRPRFDLLVNLLAARAVQNGVITIFNQSQWRPFIHVWDVARGFSAALDAPLGQISGQIFNLGDSRMNFTLEAVAEEIRRAFPNTKVQYVENDDKRSYNVDFAKIRKDLGYQCTVSLREGVQELKRALQDGTVPDYTDARYNNQKFLEHAGNIPVTHEMDHNIMAAFAGRPPYSDAVRNA